MPLNLDNLISEQKRLASRLVIRDVLKDFKTVGGADQAFLGDEIVSSIVVCSSGTLKVTEMASSMTRASSPYIPTFLSYREAPPIIEAWRRLSIKPDVLLIDGQGIAHPRGMGLASHVGLLLDIPTIGVAKSWLFGDFREPREFLKAEKILSGGRQTGWALKTKEGCRPLFISPGHKVSIESSLSIVTDCLKGHRLPEPLKLAHDHANIIKKSWKSKAFEKSVEEVK